jgi:hypothetical protein
MVRDRAQEAAFFDRLAPPGAANLFDRFFSRQNTEIPGAAEAGDEVDPLL